MTDKLKKTISYIVDRAVMDILQAVKMELLDAVAEEVEKPKVAKPKKAMNEDRMRCRFSDDNGHRCKNRSKGPRFKYLCEKHLEK